MQVAAAAVFAEYGTVPWLRCMGLVVSAILIIAWLNLRCSPDGGQMPDFAVLNPSFSMVHPHQEATHHPPFNNLFPLPPRGVPPQQRRI